MPDLLLEFFSEEIPARMQAKAADDLRKIVTDRLVAAGLTYEGAKAFATPRRLALSVHGVLARQPDIKEEKKGPRVGAPEGAIAGFLKAAGLKSIAEAKVQPDKKGDFYVAVIEKPGRPAIEVIGEMIPEVVRGFPWPKSMRWGSRPAHLGAPAAFHRRHLRPGDRRARGRHVRRRRHRRRQRDARPPLHGAGRDQGAPLRRLRRQPRKGQGGARSGAPRRHDPRRRQEPRLRARLRAGRGRRPARRSRRPGGMAGHADGLVRPGLPRDPRRGDPRHHPQQPEMLRAARSADGQAGEQVHPGRQYRSQRPRQGHRRRQRARHPRAAVRRQVLLRHRSEDAAGRPAAEIRADRVPREARHAGRAHRAHRGARRPARAASSAPMSRRPNAPRFCARPICSPRWSANSPSCKA